MQRKIKLKTFLELVKRINSGSKWVKINITVETKGGLISYSHEKFTPHKAEIKAQHVSCDFQQMCHKYGVETRLIETDTCC